MSIPITYRDETYYIVSRDILKLYNVLYCGTLYIDGTRYRKYESYDRKLLVEF